MMKTGETGSRTQKQRHAARRSSSRWKQRAKARRAARGRSGAVRKTPVSQRTNGTARKERTLRFRPPPVGQILSGLRRDDTTLPGWRDLASVAGQSSSRPRSGDYLERISPGRFVVMLLLVALAATLYVGHIHATQALVADLEQAKRQNMELHLQHNRLRGDFDRMTGPAVITERARALGLYEGVANRPAIVIPVAND